MPVTFITAPHSATELKWAKVLTHDELLEKSCRKHHDECKSIIQHSFDEQLFRKTHISPDSNGFVRAVLYAYSNHHHLTLRPEDIWFAILTQFSFYVNAHGEELRSFFVSHEGKKELEIKTTGTSRTVDFGIIAMRMTKLIEENVVDPDLRAWIIPNFTTTTETDQVVAAILMMGTLQNYFEYLASMLCGIPTVTLLGERADWEAILHRVEKLPQFGKEPAQFAELLRPVLRRFVASFDDPTSPDILDFWAKCVHQKRWGSGSTALSGWMTAFCFWTDEGRSLYGYNHPSSRGDGAGCELDGVLFHKIDMSSIPNGFASVPLKVNDNGREYDSMMIAGLVGIQATSNGLGPEDKGHIKPDSIRPLSGWWMYEKKSSEELDKSSEVHRF